MTRIKICGLRTEADIQAANQCKPDYVGFVFAPGSKRRITPQTAAKLRAMLDPQIQTVGVFVNEDPNQILQLCEQGTIHCIQLHGEEPEEYVRSLRTQTVLPLIRSVSVSDCLPKPPAEADFLLYDTASPDRGGTGKPFDWRILEPISGSRWFLAGGLDCNNVEQAVQLLHPYAVDVSSGVESHGVKDPEKMARFVAIVRAMR